MVTNEATLLLLIILALLAGIVGAGAAWAYVRLRRVPPTVYGEMERTIADMNQQLNEMRAQLAAEHLARMALQVRITELEIGLKIQAAQIRRLGEVPEYTPTTPGPAAAVVDEKMLSEGLATLFNADELDDLIMRLDVPDGQVAGETTAKLSRELVRYMQRRGRLADLLAAARQLRPDGGF